MRIVGGLLVPPSSQLQGRQDVYLKKSDSQSFCSQIIILCLKDFYSTFLESEKLYKTYLVGLLFKIKIFGHICYKIFKSF